MKCFLLFFLLFTTLCTKAQKEIGDTSKQTAAGTTREASFPGGDMAWRAFVTKLLERNIDALISDGKSGVCRIRFIVNEDGTLGNIEALTMQDSQLAKRSIKAISKGPNWIPAMHNGKYVKAFRVVPITFTLSNQ